MFEDIFRTGSLEVIDWKGHRHSYGDGTGSPVTIKLHDAQVEWEFLRNYKLALGELYMDERLTIEKGSLYDFINTCAINRGSLKHHGILSWRSYIKPLITSLATNNPKSAAIRNARHAYDLKEELFRLFLDEDLQYSCAYWTYDEKFQPVNTLEEAQFDKKEHLAAKLHLHRPGMYVLDVGCGWGGLAIHLAREYGANVRGITLSPEQLRVAQQRAEEAGVSDRVEFQLCDYREVGYLPNNRAYDRIVSVEMLEHVGAKHNLSYFRTLQKLLQKNGIFVLQWGGRMGPPTPPNPWIEKYIFPGGYTPALSEIAASIEKAVFWMNDIECHHLHYADTLKEWNRRFQLRRSEAADMYDERFCRMWEYYLNSCEVSFRTVSQCVYQIQMTTRRHAIPQSRDYLFLAEQRRRQARMEQANPQGRVAAG